MNYYENKYSIVQFYDENFISDLRNIISYLRNERNKRNKRNKILNYEFKIKYVILLMVLVF